MAGRTIVILGGGVGGLVAANELRQRLSRQHRIVLVEKNPQHAFAPSFLWLMTGDRKPEQITRPVRQLVRSGIELMEAEAHGIDVRARRVETGEGSLTYDYLIVALGAELAPESIPGLADALRAEPARLNSPKSQAEAAQTFYTFEGTIKLRDALQKFTGGTVAVVVSAMPYKCPGAPHEGAMLIADTFRKRNMGEKVEVHLFTPEPQPMPVAGPELGDAVKQMLESKGIAFHPLHKLAAVNSENHELLFEGGESVQYNMLVAIPPHRSPRLVREAGLANEAGWVPVDHETLATRHENVYAVGDVTAIPIPGRWKPDVPLMLPKAGVFAHDHARTVARRVAAEINGTSIQDTFCGDGYCMLEAGEDLAGFAFGNFFAEPSPEVQLRKMGRVWHLGKVLLEQWWLAPYGPRREALHLALTLGGKALGIPTVV